MHWSSWSEFFSMGGYGSYVWGSYGVTFVLLAAEVLMLIKRSRSVPQRRSAAPIEAQASELETVL